MSLNLIEGTMNVIIIIGNVQMKIPPEYKLPKGLFSDWEMTKKSGMLARIYYEPSVNYWKKNPIKRLLLWKTWVLS